LLRARAGRAGSRGVPELPSIPSGADDAISSSDATDESDTEEEAEVEVRMIDFANTSCYVEDGDPVPEDVNLEEPDKGYMLGLENLAHFLRMLREEMDAEQATATT
jgi:hypothetical protein